MEAPAHSINIDFTHSSEAKVLFEVIVARFDPQVSPEAESFLESVEEKLMEAIEVMESVEV